MPRRDFLQSKQNVCTIGSVTLQRNFMQHTHLRKICKCHGKVLGKSKSIPNWIFPLIIQCVARPPQTNPPPAPQKRPARLDAGIWGEWYYGMARIYAGWRHNKLHTWPLYTRSPCSSLSRDMRHPY